MTTLRISCPQCEKQLLLQDQRLLGRKGKCPGCGHRFLLHETASRGEAEPKLADTNLAVPSCPVHEGEPIDIITDPAADPVSQIGRRRRKGRSGKVIAAGAVLFLIAAAGTALYRLTTEPAPIPVPSQPVAGVAADRTVDRSAMFDAEELLEIDSPPGEPISLLMVPSGARILIHLRPAELWSDDSRMAELRASLTQDVITAAETRLRDLTSREPEAIEEVLVAWILGARGSEPQIATVVHLTHEERLSDLIEEFGSESLDEFSQPKVYLHEDQAVLIRDRRTLAFAPRELASELADWAETPNVNTSDGILAMLDHTDRKRLLTIVFEPADVQRHLDELCKEPIRPIVRQVAAWLGETAETVAWSMHTGEAFRSEIVLRNRSTQSPTSVEEQMKEKMLALPAEMLGVVRQMNPQRSGFRRMIGRYPAMLEVYRRATVTAVEDRAVRLTTILPPKAGPNLALATVLTWDESRRSGTGNADPSVLSSPADLPSRQTVAERLSLSVDAEFNRTPLQEAINYIAGEISVRIEIDGDALKDAGYTKNMPQTFDLGEVPAATALWEILKQYQEAGKELVLVVDEPGSRAILLTKKFAAAQGLTPLDLKTE